MSEDAAIVSTTHRFRTAALWLGAAAVLLALATTPAPGQVQDNAPEASECTLRFGWEPYGLLQFIDDEGIVTGAEIELFREVADEVGCQVVLRHLPWARILLEIETGTLDLTASASRTSERLRYARFSVPYRSTEMALIVRAGEAGDYDLRTLADIGRTDFRLGVIWGYHYGEQFSRLMQEPAFAAQVEGAADYVINIQKLIHRRIDGIMVDDIAVLLGEARASRVLHQVERHPLRVAGDDLHFMFSRATVSPELVEEFNGVLLRMEADGSLARLFCRFRHIQGQQPAGTAATGCGPDKQLAPNGSAGGTHR
ncbi:MAG: hypothetical protein EA405_07355 [Rhodospirillales bacterium]|nr:MAG: hypothetical protein EA405_07355 [Rhodospirillales bacterium]